VPTNPSESLEHVGNVRTLLQPSVSDNFERVLDQHVPLHNAREPHEAIWAAAWELVGAEA
jgi:hypothetical protein